MNKISNWVFGSFFRTLGRVLVYFLIGILVSYLLKNIDLSKINIWQILNVSAANYEMGEVISNAEVKMNNNIISTTQKQYFPANTNINLHIESPYVWNPANNEIDYQYGYISICASSDFTPLNFNPGYNSKNATFFNSYQKCQVANSNYDRAFIYYITWQINISRVCTTGTTNTYCSLDNNYDFRVDKDMEFSLIDFGLSDKQIEVDTSNGVIINQNQSIINSIGNLSNNINNTENAINYNGEQGRINDDKNTDKMIDSQKVCKIFDNNSSIEVEHAYLNSSGGIVNYDLFNITGYINVFESKVIVNKPFSANYAYVCFYQQNKTLISCSPLGSLQEGSEITMPDNTYYIRSSVWRNTNAPNYEICKNGNQAVSDNLSDINSSLTDDSPPTNLDSLSNSAGWLPPGPVDSILNLPLSFLTNLNTNLSKSCQPVNLPLPFIDKLLPLPCVNSLYDEINGLPNWINIIGTIASAFMLFGYFINLYKYIDDTLTFRENNYIDNWSGV